MEAMDVKDRHLKVIVDIINAVVNTLPPLRYLSQRFIPVDVILRLRQMISIYEKSISLSTDEGLHSVLTPDFKTDGDCLTACSVIRHWLLDYYRDDYVISNCYKLEVGSQEVVVLTTLLVLRVMYRMRQLMDQRVNQILTNGWKDLSDFDQQFDDKFDTKCVKFMSLLVKRQTKHELIVSSFQSHINALEEDNQKLMETINTCEDNSREETLFESLALREITESDDHTNDLTQEDFVQSNEISLDENPLPMGVTESDPKRVKLSLNTVNNISAINIANAQKAMRLSVSPTKQSTTRITRSLNESTRSAFNEIRAVFSESDDSDFEYFDNNFDKQTVVNSTTTLSDKLRVSPKRKTRRAKSRRSAPALRAKKTTAITSETVIQKPKKWWPSKSINYPRVKRYPCDYPNCRYIADRPSTLTRHERRHTGEKPFACDWPGCKKRYKMSSNLTPHKLTHTGDKPYSCDQCIRSFAYPQHLKRHKISFH